MSDGVDECLWAAIREAFVESGATDREIDAVAVSFVTIIVEHTPPRSEIRYERFELIAQHLACTDMRICIGGGDSWLSVEFPARPTLH